MEGAHPPSSEKAFPKKGIGQTEHLSEVDIVNTEAREPITVMPLAIAHLVDRKTIAARSVVAVQRVGAGGADLGESRQGGREAVKRKWRCRC